MQRQRRKVDAGRSCDVEGCSRSTYYNFGGGGGGSWRLQYVLGRAPAAALAPAGLARAVNKQVATRCRRCDEAGGGARGGAGNRTRGTDCGEQLLSCAAQRWRRPPLRVCVQRAAPPANSGDDQLCIAQLKRR